MYHTIIIVGNLGRDPEMRYLPNGSAVTSFSIASSRQYTGSDGQLVKETVWFRITTWGKLAETCNQYLKKGKQVLVEGRITPDSATGGPRIWTRQDGTPGASYEVTAQMVRFLGRAGDEGSSGGGEFGEAPASQSEDDIPF
jgi:single-strand DNA-binding protein